VVVGGPYATSMRQVILQDRNIDYLVLGEGEIPLSKLVRNLQNEAVQEPVDRVMSRNFPAGEVNLLADTVSALDDLPFPDFGLVRVADYFRFSSAMGTHAFRQTWPVASSRGCPYSCAFCHSHFGHKHRTRSVLRFVDEIELLHRSHGVFHFDIFDDIFNISEARVLDFCNELERRKLRIRFSFPNGLRLDRMTARSIDRMAECGLFAFGAPIESASERIRKKMNKGLNMAKAEQIVRHAAMRNVVVSGFFIFGYPTETQGEAQATIDLACKLPFTLASFQKATPFPGTQMFDELPPEKKSELMSFLSTAGPFTYSDSPNVSGMSDHALRKCYARAYLKFYLRPKVVFRLLYLLGPALVLRLGGVVLRRITTLRSSTRFTQCKEAWTR